MPTTYHHGNLRHELLREAARVLEAEGADAISLRRLARQLGVSHAAPAHHFANRADLLAELGADGYARLADSLETAMEGLEPARWLAATGKAYIGFALANPERYRLMFASKLMRQDCPPRLSEESGRAYVALLTAVRQAPPTEDLDEYRPESPELGAWSLVHGAAMLWLDGQLPGVTSEAHFIELVHAVLDR